MQLSRRFVLTISAAGVLGLFVVRPPQGGGRTPSPRGVDECEDTATAILEANQHEAQADYSLRVATCLNDPGGNFAACVQAAADQLQEDLDLAQEQYTARLFVCSELGGGAYDPQIDPSEFSTKIDNAWSPLVPGRTLMYEQRNADGVETVEVRALKEIVEIDGFKVRAVKDTVKLDGEVVEDTIDYFAQRDDGDVWYFGEVSKSFEDGFLDNLDGSWRTGKDGAKPGVAMPAVPALGVLYRQEFLVNEAEDVARALSVTETVTVPYGTFTNCLKTEEFTPSEPDQLEWKYYAQGVGLVLVVDQTTGDRLELVHIKK